MEVDVSVAVHAATQGIKHVSVGFIGPTKHPEAVEAVPTIFKILKRMKHHVNNGRWIYRERRRAYKWHFGTVLLRNICDACRLCRNADFGK